MMINQIASVMLGLAFGAATMHAQNPVHWTASSKAKSTTPGGNTAVTLTATIDSGWHIYSLTQGPGGPFPTRIAVASGQPFALDGKVEAPKPAVAHDPNFGIDVETYERSAAFAVPIKVDTTATNGKHTIQLSTRYEACNAMMCLPPKTVKFTVPVTVTKKAARKG
jgi:thiol:disulfide interchange protein DsbD